LLTSTLASGMIFINRTPIFVCSIYKHTVTQPVDVVEKSLFIAHFSIASKFMLNF